MASSEVNPHLLESLNDWTQNLQDGCQTFVIYVDFSKAFEVVQHDKLLLKLRAVGIDGDLLVWIKNWLSCRTFQTRVNDLLSAVCNLLTGVIQGSVLGPLMFLIYVGVLQEALTALVSWAEEWQLSVAIDKCWVLQIGKGEVQTAICVNDSPLPVVSGYFM